MKVHFIAIGGSAMHNLAIALHNKGYVVSGSDDEIFNPAHDRLKALELLPEKFGWFPEKITQGIDAVILGMHAKGDNPELAKAKELGLPVYSYPEFLYEQSKDKTRVVIGGSHGKTTITAMILHVLGKAGIDFDYMVGAQLRGFDVMVKLSESAKVMIFEGDEYLTSALDPRPKFHVYMPHIALVSGIAWDHMNVFKTFDDYIEQFRIFMNMIPANGSLIYCAEDKVVEQLAAEKLKVQNKIPYFIPEHRIVNGITILKTERGEVPLAIFGNHNLMNIEGARYICRSLGVSSVDFYNAISTFTGAANRLEIIYSGEKTTVFRDFAHAPSKLKATVNAAKNQYSERKLTACFELHTYSSLSKEFMPQYAGCMDEADDAIVYYSPHALEIKRLPSLDKEFILDGFGRKDLRIFTSPEKLKAYLISKDWNNHNLLMMSSGNFDGITIDNLREIAEN